MLIPSIFAQTLNTKQFNNTNLETSPNTLYASFIDGRNTLIEVQVEESYQVNISIPCKVYVERMNDISRPTIRGYF